MYINQSIKNAHAMDTKNSEFFHFGVLPQVCIHSPIHDQYSDSYIPEKSCKCGSEEWLEEGCTMILFHYADGTPAYKDVHRCKKCYEVRMATHKGIKKEECQE